MRIGSLFSGIGGFDLGMEMNGMKIVWQVEIDNACSRILERNWPAVRRYRDVRKTGVHNLEPVDLVCGGFPCQDLSVAGRRSGLAGDQSGLFFEFIRVIAELSPRWAVIENVPGLLSSNGGRDMGTVLGALAELGYGYAWRVLDAQYFGVAQRRRRVFIVGHLGTAWSAPAKVLFEPESVSGDPPPSRETGQVSATLLASGAGTSRPAGIGSETDFLVIQSQAVAHTVTTRAGMRWNPASDTHIVQDSVMPRLETDFLVAAGFRGRSDLSHALRANASRADKPDSTTYIVSNTAVRRLSPLECERLQGFDDDWTEGESDSVRYRMLGNAVCVPVARWIGKRILELREK